jgi:putative hemolysin
MLQLTKGRFTARLAAGGADVARAQALRARVFRGDTTGQARDADRFDAICAHVLVEEMPGGRLVCCYRLMPLNDGSEIGRSYSAQYYELSALEQFEGKMMELGRFCIHPDFARDPDILRVAWGAMTQNVDAERVEMLFGCASFAGTKTEAYADAFGVLKERHLAPARWLPKVKAPDVFRFARRLASRPNPQRGLLTMPPLLRTYLMMGGCVSDHAVVDRDLDTLHVFTGLEIAAIPAARKRALRAVAG